MKKSALMLGIVLALSTSAMAVDIAISTRAGWWAQTAADQEVQDIVNNVKGASVQLFTTNDLAALANWVIAHTGDGAPDLLILCGIFPDTIYPAGNAKPEGSLAELFLDDGNTIINTGDYIFYVGSAANNDAGGLANMLDVPAAAMWGDDSLATSFVPTADGKLYTPSLPAAPSNRPWIPAQFVGTDWSFELILAQNSDGSQVMPGILRNSVTGGRVGAFFQVADQFTNIRGEVISEWINNWYLPLVAAGTGADNPMPTDKATDVPLDTILSWTPGQTAATRDVYFGTAFADVNAASRANPMGVLASQDQTAVEFDPEGLFEYGQTYFWRIDEVNGAPDNTIFTGKTWSFTAEQYSYPVTPVAATASSYQIGYGPENTINGSGLNADDEHSLLLSEMWMADVASPHWIQYEFDKAYKLDKMWVWNSNQIIEGFVGFGARNVTVEYSADGTTWAALEGVPEFAQATGSPDYKANTTVDFGGVSAKFVKLNIGSNWGGVAPQTGLSEVRFFSVPVQAFKPQPAIDATNVSVATDLSWRPGREATSHKVAIGTDSAAVAGGAGAQTVTDHRYAPADLLLGTQYFWKVDEVGDAGEHAGEVWNFTTEPFTIVDDFERYKDNIDAQDTIWHTWIDGLTDQASGSVVGYDAAPFAERTVVRAGVQAMPMTYDNSSFAFSEAKRTFDPGQDWTAHGVKTLSIHFAGVADNTGKLYVKINNAKVAYNGDDADLARPGWQAWNIDLTKVSGVNNVRSLTIGVEGSGAKGKLYIDDIRLSPQAPTFTTPVEPDSAALIGRWAFDGDVKDSSGKGRNGTANGGPTFGPGVDGQALHLDGTDDFVVVGSVGISGAAPRTLSGWVKADTTTITDWTNIFGFTSSPDGVAGKSFDMNKIGGSNNYCIHAYGWERVIMPIDLEWHHLAATYDGTTVKWYGDGGFVAGEAWVLDTQDIVHMGKRAHAAGGNFPGSVDEVRIYNKALSADEIAWLAGRRSPVHNPQ